MEGGETMISERTLKTWRREALALSKRTIQPEPTELGNAIVLLTKELNTRILRMTQELLDQNLLMKGK